MSASEYEKRLEEAARKYCGYDVDLYDAFMAGAGKAKYLTFLYKACSNIEQETKENNNGVQRKSDCDDREESAQGE